MVKIIFIHFCLGISQILLAIHLLGLLIYLVFVMHSHILFICLFKKIFIHVFIFPMIN